MKAHITEQEQIMKEAFQAKLRETLNKGMLQGCVGILGAIKNMCDEGCSIEEIKTFCTNFLEKNKNSK